MGSNVFLIFAVSQFLSDLKCRIHPDEHIGLTKATTKSGDGEMITMVKVTFG
jgi:hypothetical protein